MVEKYIGVVVWFDAKLGYGFIKQENPPDMFVHYSDIVADADEYKILKKGQTVAYSLGVNKHGTPKAVDVVIIDKK